MCRPTHHDFTDAAGRSSCGVVWGMLWLHYPWQDKMHHKPIAMLKLPPITLAAMIWVCQWTSSLVVVHFNNQAVVAIVNAGYSKDN